MAEEADRQGNDKGIGEGNLSKERGAPPYADRAYAGEQEPGGGGNSPSQTGTAGGTNVSSQGGGTDSSQQGGNTGSTSSGSR
jgi:hypothetical protein